MNRGLPAALLGVSLALGMPALLALPSFLFPPERSGQCYGLYQTLYSLGFGPEGRVFIGTETGGVVTSVDNGATFAPVDWDWTNAGM